jgi:hypothetical protein
MPELVQGLRPVTAVFAGYRLIRRLEEQTFSEILYFLSDDDLTHTASLTIQSLAPKGLVLLVNYLRQTDDPQSGNSAVELFLRATAPHLHILEQQRKLLYRIDLLAR